MAHYEGGMPPEFGPDDNPTVRLDAVIDGEHADAELVDTTPDPAMEEWLEDWQSVLDKATVTASEMAQSHHDAAIAAKKNPGERKKVKVVDEDAPEEDEREVRTKREFVPSAETEAYRALEPDVYIRRIMRDQPPVSVRNLVNPKAWAAWVLPHSIKESTLPEDRGLVGWTIMTRKLGSTAAAPAVEIVEVPAVQEASADLAEGMADAGVDLPADILAEQPAAPAQPIVVEKKPEEGKDEKDAKDEGPQYERVVLGADGTLWRIVTPTEPGEGKVTYAGLGVREGLKDRKLGQWRRDREVKLLKAYRQRNESTTPARRPWRLRPEAVTNYVPLTKEHVRSIGAITMDSLRPNSKNDLEAENARIAKLIGVGDNELTSDIVWDGMDEFRRKHNLPVVPEDSVVDVEEATEL